MNIGGIPDQILEKFKQSNSKLVPKLSDRYKKQFECVRRALLKILNEENFASSESVLFIDSLIERECGGNILQDQWRNDGGNGLYPPPSLQALLRTYLIDNVDLPYKHSIIIYVFLDLAMTLDQDRYKPVITHLIKFPAVFKVSPSVIKITQAFWQLDHSDYNSAMGLLLDPLILPEDLSHWHHKVVLRALMLQKQHNLALLYVQVRKPVLKDDDDILTAISLYVANNMLDEAFYFEKHCINQKQEDKFLCHLFNECKKNDKLKSLLYRSLNSADENFFLSYLTNSKMSNAEDLHVYYHLLRSHFIEAFESHERSVPHQIENQGLFGQENAIPRDKLIYSLKKLLPDVNRNLLSLCHKERSNTWQQVSRPTPMSVFVYNATENVQYKSTIIGAALAKAKQTFTETVNQKFKVETEGTPFLRTPTVTPRSRRSSAVIVNPRVSDVNTTIDDSTSPPSLKRMKLSPRLNASVSVAIPTKLDTPLVKRKTPRPRDGTEERRVVTPQSILKVKSLINHAPSKKDGEFEDDFKEFGKIEYTPVTTASKKSGIGLSPRKSLHVVRFEGVKSSSSSSIEKSLESPVVKSTPEKMSLSPVVKANSSVQLDSSSKNTSTEEEIFYSPDASLEEVDKKKTVTEIEKSSIIDEKIEVPREDKQVSIDASVNDPEEKSDEKLKPSPIFSPTKRKSYRRSLGQTTPVRSSPRLSRNTSLTNESLPSSPRRQSIPNKDSVLASENLSREDSFINNTVAAEKTEEKDEPPTESPKSSSILPKLRPRKSLCRKVLETNALNRVINSPLDSPRSRRSKNMDSPKVTNTEEVTEKIVLESKSKYEDGEEIHHSSVLKKHNLTTSFLESDVDISETGSIDYGDGEELALSDSMQKYINSSCKASSTRYSFLDNSDVKETNSGDTSKKNFAESSLQSLESEKIASEAIAKISKDDEETNEVSVENKAGEVIEKQNASTKTILEDVSQSQTQQIVNQDIVKLDDTYNVSELKEENTVEDHAFKNITDTEIVQNKSVIFDGNSTVNHSKSLVYSVLDSSVDAFSMSYNESGPKLSDSMIRCINDRERKEKSQSEDIEVMEVDEEVEVIEENDESVKDKSEVLVYTTLKNSELIETDKDTRAKEKSEKSAVGQENKAKENVETCDVESDSNRPIDPEMNVFEISDDLSFNDGLMVEKEVTLGENDLCYGQQNTLESVLEENIRPVSSSPVNELEKNVFNESEGSEEESVAEENEDEEEPDVDEEEDVAEEQEEPNVEEENEELNIKTNANQTENDVIEIGSSSEEDNSKDESSSSESQNSSGEYESDEGKLDVSYERNIYDSENDSCSESNDERSYTEISENSDDDQIEEGCGLFEGDIVCFEEEEDEKNAKNEDKPVEQVEKEKTDDEIQVGIESDDVDMRGENTVEQDSKLLYEVMELSREAIKDIVGESSCSISVQENKIVVQEVCTSEEIAQEQVQNQNKIREHFNADVKDTPIAEDSEQKQKKVENEEPSRENIGYKSEITSPKPSATCLETTSSEKGISDMDVEQPKGKLESDLEPTVVNYPEGGKPVSEDADVSVEMDELNYSFPDEGSLTERDVSQQQPAVSDVVTADSKDGRCMTDETVLEEKDTEHTVADADQTIEQNTDVQDTKMCDDTIREDINLEDPLDTVVSGPVVIKRNSERDVLDSTPYEAKTRPRTRSASVSSSKSAKSEKNCPRSESASEEVPKQRKRRTKDILEDLNMNTPKREPDIIEDLLKTTKPGRALRSRRGSTEENSTPTVTLRKRSASVDDTKINMNASVEKESGDKRRGRRASSVLNLPKIPEEDETSKKSKSVVEGYSMSRRVTRQQVSLLKKIGGVKYDVESLDPIVLLDRVPFEGKPDLEEQKVYNSSPSTTNSTSSTPVKASKRLRSASQASESSEKSRTPVRSVRARSRKKSTDEESTSKKSLKDVIESIEESSVSSEPRMTRSRAKSVSSVHSDDSNVSESVKMGAKRQRRVSQSTLSKIQEEPDKKEKSPVPKKRTRKNSSQI